MKCGRKAFATSSVSGRSVSFFESGRTATLIGARRGSRRSTVRFSTLPSPVGASSSSYAASRNASVDRSAPAEGSMTYGT